jgi:hypothetical protein
MSTVTMSAMASGLVCGTLFGYVLENAGFGSPVKLSAQFRLTDWAVFKVMFTAIVVAALGLWLLRVTGLMPPDSIAVPQALLMASAVGGALVGAGFAVGGYCPGTSVVGMVSGRIDALVFVAGVLAGTALFAVAYGPALRSLMAIGGLVEGDTFTDVWGVPEPLVLAVLVASLVAVFMAGSWFERRGGGTVSAQQAVAGASAGSPGA